MAKTEYHSLTCTLPAGHAGLCRDSDPVNSPSHYTDGGIETIDYLKAKLTPEEFRGFLKGNALKYLSRAGKKGAALEDVQKAQWYGNRLMIELTIP